MGRRRCGHTIGARPHGTPQRLGRRGWWWLAGGGVLSVGLAVFFALEVGGPRSAPSEEIPDLPGIDVFGLDAEQRQLLVARAKDERCPCQCGFTLADCRGKDLSCPVSGPVLRRLVNEYRMGRPLEEPK